jgi:hypothetical protein
VLPGRTVLRNRAFLNAENGLAGVAVEHKEKPHLRCLHDHRKLHPIALHRRQRRLRRHVVVPQIIVHRGEAPDALTRRAFQRDDRAAVVRHCHTVAAVIVRRCVTGRKKDEIALDVHGHRCPDVRRTEGITFGAGILVGGDEAGWREIPGP